MNDPLPDSLVGATVVTVHRNDGWHASLLVTSRKRLEDLYADGFMSLSDYEEKRGLLDMGTPASIDLGAVDVLPGALMHFNPMKPERVGVRHGFLDLARLSVDWSSEPVTAFSAELLRPELSIPCVNRECGGSMALKVECVPRSFPWSLRHRWKTLMYFQCDRCAVRSDRWSGRETAPLIAEGFFALRVWAVRGLPKAARKT